MMRWYTLAIIGGLFLLWAWMSDWSLDLMLFWEGHDYHHDQDWFKPTSRTSAICVPHGDRSCRHALIGR